MNHRVNIGGYRVLNSHRSKIDVIEMWSREQSALMVVTTMVFILRLSCCIQKS